MNKGCCLKQRVKCIGEKYLRLKKFLADIAALKDEGSILTDADWDEMANLRLQTNLTRTVVL